MEKRKKHAQPTGGVTRVKAACGHLVSYPSPWNQFVKRGHGYITLEPCPCAYEHIIIIQKSGIDVLTTDNPFKAAEMVHELPFEFRRWYDQHGEMIYKRFTKNDAKIIGEFMDRLSKIQPPKSEFEKAISQAIRARYASLLI